MEGALTRVAGYVGLTRKKADLETIQRYFEISFEKKTSAESPLKPSRKRLWIITTSEWRICYLVDVQLTLLFPDR